MGDHTAFFYGTLMAPQVLYRVLWLTSKPSKELRDKLTIQPAMLHDYCRHKVSGVDYPGIIKQEGKSVLGVYVIGLTDDNIRNLDVFEGSQYAREKVQVKLLEGVKIMEIGGEEGKVLDAETYVFLDRGDLVEEEWDFNEFVRDKMWRWADCSEEYAEVDNTVASSDHDPTGGRGVNGGMEEKLMWKDEDEILVDISESF